MKGILLALLSFAIFLFISILLLRIRRWKKHFKALLVAFPLSFLFFLWSYSITPASVYFLPADWIEPSRWVDCFNGVLLSVLLFHCFWDVLYATAITGFSAGIMVKLEHSSSRGITAEQIMYSYKDGEIKNGIFARRMANLLQGGYIRRDGDKLSLTCKGRVVACMVLFLKQLLGVGKGG